MQPQCHATLVRCVKFSLWIIPNILPLFIQIRIKQKINYIMPKSFWSNRIRFTILVCRTFPKLKKPPGWLSHRSAWTYHDFLYCTISGRWALLACCMDDLLQTVMHINSDCSKQFECPTSWVKHLSQTESYLIRGWTLALPFFYFVARARIYHQLLQKNEALARY